ncbi:hypothetical protein R69608_03505 [Paraburkholderia nemoris]|uniref:DUF1254 domain-containing protein n=1 Tax=Paraburkholderia nemoris TaxID=2793076 RepID=UPI00191399CF|nr:DUF1254 domain-containing protein [Paraburkholderia nemoris]MBK5148976.1 DUF1254 domain-containing protein [Burkholderia sp. R-69608]CAE6910751.1 hypothetical protein R69608_03505 [Paraburkholderia nemoris]
MNSNVIEAREAISTQDDDPRVAFVRMAAAPVAIYGYPLVEVIRTCAMHTSPGSTSSLRAPFNSIHASMRRWTHQDRDVVTPANDFLYLNAWIDLSDGPVVLDIPAVDEDRYYVIELLDAFTNNFVNLSPLNAGSSGKRYVLHREGEAAPASLNAEPIACPTPLVWMLGRVLVKGDNDLPEAQQAASGFALSGRDARGFACVRDWRVSAEPALDFFQNLFNALRDVSPRPDETALFGLLARADLCPGKSIDVETLSPFVRRGLQLAYEDAHRLITVHTESRGRRSWGYNLKLGRYGSDYLLRACTAMKGLGALSATEAVYAVADFDGAGEHLNGRHRYELYFPPGGLPPVHALWSISLYGADRFFVENPLARHAIGDRTEGLRYEADGGLRILIQHDAPPVEANWLPAPSAQFYLILRLYQPAAAFLENRYEIPAVRNLNG